MPIAYPLTKQFTRIFLSQEEFASLIYHDIFDYPLTTAELIKWSAGSKALIINHQPLTISQTNGFYHLSTNPGAVLKRLMRKRISARKVEIARRAADVISLIPTVKVVAITGALAMENALDESDVDLMVITKRGTLWTTRLLVYFSLFAFRFSLRRPKDKTQKDKLCLNMWLDENYLAWHPSRRNIYTAHEIAQTTPIINRGQTYEKFIAKNAWTREYWSNAVKVRGKEDRMKNLDSSPLSAFLIPLEKIAFKLQYAYMRKKITRETVTKTRALFHPVDWSKYVLQKLSS